MRSTVVFRVLLVVALGFGVAAAWGAEPELIVEGVFDGTPWVETVSMVDLVSGVLPIGAAGTLSSVGSGRCSGEFMTEIVFSGDNGDVAVAAAELSAAFGWPSSAVLRVGFGDAGFPGCWPDGDPIHASRRLRVSDITIDDHHGGDGDGFAECGESVVIGVKIASITETMADAHVVVQVLGSEATLAGVGSSPIPDLAPGQEVAVDTGFMVRATDTVTGSDWITLVVWVGTHDTVFESHRHIPLGCDLSGSFEVSPQVAFPVAGPNHYSREWLTTFNSAIHEGTDVFASRMVPIVAMADGVIADVNWDKDPHHLDPPLCCALALRHDSGWESWYLHLNNDTPGTDDGQGWGIMPGIQPGTRVQAGQIIGFMGDSSNAEGTAPHLHVELHDPAGNPVDPYDYLALGSVVDPICVGGTEQDCSPFVVLSWNSRDPQVRLLQTRLGSAGFSPGVADGFFGNRTDSAVREFQEAAGLGVDGLVDAETWNELDRVVTEGIDLLPDVVARRGDRGPIVIEIQSLLARAGLSPGPVDGIFGSLTEWAVRSFQSDAGLPVDGRVDSPTFAALGEPSQPAPSSPAPSVVKRGDRGLVVIQVQDLLTATGFAPGAIDGIFGSLTERAVRSYQSAHGLSMDGIVGPVTHAALSVGGQRGVIARYGDRGPTVIEVQTLLTAAGFPPGPIDGDFGALTRAAVVSFQTARGLTIDGVIDEATFNALG